MWSILNILASQWGGILEANGPEWGKAILGESHIGGKPLASIVPFISNAVFEQADIAVMSDAYNRAIEDIYSFGRPNKTVEALIATRIITLTKGGERDPDRLRERALAACGFNADRAR
jgi:hypothetical protein